MWFGWILCARFHLTCKVFITDAEMNDFNYRNLMGLTWYTHGNQKRDVIRSHTRSSVEELEGQESEVNNSGSRHSFDFKIFGSKGEKPKVLLEEGFRMSFPKG